MGGGIESEEGGGVIEVIWLALGHGAERATEFKADGYLAWERAIPRVGRYGVTCDATARFPNQDDSIVPVLRMHEMCLILTLTAD